MVDFRIDCSMPQFDHGRDVMDTRLVPRRLLDPVARKNEKEGRGSEAFDHNFSQVSVKFGSVIHAWTLLPQTMTSRKRRGRTTEGDIAMVILDGQHRRRMFTLFGCTPSVLTVKLPPTALLNLSGYYQNDTHIRVMSITAPPHHHPNE